MKEVRRGWNINMERKKDGSMERRKGVMEMDGKEKRKEKTLEDEACG